jgi:cytochrome P450
MAPAVVADPYSYFAALREREPVRWNAQVGAWIITRYDDVQAAFRDARLSADRISPYYRPKLGGPNGEVLRPAYENLSRWMVFIDPPEHTRLRALVVKAFTPRIIEALGDKIRDTVRELLDEAPAGELELIRDLAYPLPVIIVGEMFGVPRQDRERIKTWSDEIVLVVMGALDVPDRHERARRAFVEFEAYLREKIGERRKRPTGDLLSQLIAAEERGDVLSEQEIVSTCLMLLFAGHETTTNLIGNGVLALLEHPAELVRLRAKPEIMAPAIEELLRYDGPVKAMWRIALADFEMRGRTIRRGDRVLLVLAGANRDPSRFVDPDRLDLGRDKNAHVGFGYGAHYCLGAPLARLETQVAVSALLARHPRLGLTAAPRSWHPTVLTRSLYALPLAT